MSEVSVADAKTHLTRLLQRVEAGEPVQITRRGRPVAVLISQAEYQRLAHPRQSLVEFVNAWRAEMKEQAIAFADEDDFEGVRDQGERAAPDFG
ncbi:MAG: type II toxin-antitoxin system Phd/YefM family antitoxin [Burkholderiales bacterium]|nr:type II toxin-antitoxin system Phd/YefM family antitoxin [Burkholderiales bacterium]